eukprot:CAMPEP_0175791780 /NCGR_PEP_ID=MMETSP0097-20121207/82624_1 /TAXON_ID=311494 /ORGANISM="Alexandrium monilatum, Strain CCMP3105" /LENGTH=70 /DNA_ID=CAMNT_0017102941 /DNA_START=11 /DNA_END=220 /DNA_ORIENTATION=+
MSASSLSSMSSIIASSASSTLSQIRLITLTCNSSPLSPCWLSMPSRKSSNSSRLALQVLVPPLRSHPRVC